MIDFQPEIYTSIKNALLEKYTDILITAQIDDSPSKFPCVQIEESGNLPVEWDSGPHSEFALLTYRVRVYTNLESGRIAQAREIMSVVDDAMELMNFTRKTFEPLPALYNNSAYEIECTYTAVVRSDGTLYRR